MKHLEFERLVDNLEGRLSAGEEQEVSEHLEVCAGCSASAAKLAELLGYLEAGRTEQVRQADTARLLNIFTSAKTAAGAEPPARRLLGSLIFDDWQAAPAERFESADSRSLLYRAEEFEIDLRLSFAEGKCRLSGQVFPDCAENAAAEVTSEGTSEKAFLNDYCEFVFPPLDEGTYNFRIELGAAVIEIENLPLLS